MPDILPSQVLAAVARAIPQSVREHVVIIGSLAAAYGVGDEGLLVRTKDVDSVLVPRVRAVQDGRAIARSLLDAAWRPKRDPRFLGNPDAPDDELPALRLHPPDHDDWFLELLTEPERGQDRRGWLRMPVADTHYGLPSFAFTGLAIWEAPLTPFGIRCARPDMMALANLLEHRAIAPTVIGTTSVKRSNKDLGRVLAIARLADPEGWAEPWWKALQELFPADAGAFARSAGAGLRALIASPGDLQQATETCNNGLLASRPVRAAELRIVAERLLAFALTDLSSAGS